MISPVSSNTLKSIFHNGRKTKGGKEQSGSLTAEVAEGEATQRKTREKPSFVRTKEVVLNSLCKPPLSGRIDISQDDGGF